MRLPIDASTLIAELLRERGRQLMADAAFELVVATEAWRETTYELEKRIALLLRPGHLPPEEEAPLWDAIGLVETYQLSIIPPNAYANYVGEALWRIPRDPNDVPTVALAPARNSGIWTGDRDFFGCGIPVWTTETLLAYLDHQEVE